LPYVTNALIGDSTNANFLESLGINNYDVCIETIGNDFQSSLETTSLLKELGGKMVVSRANREVQEKFLLRNGAESVQSIMNSKHSTGSKTNGKNIRYALETRR
jgi:trk system potassium uptake protein TrkA